MKFYIFAILSFLIIALAACEKDADLSLSIEEDQQERNEDTLIINVPILADVLSAVAAEYNEEYTFAVEVESPDIDCDQYAIWWEIISCQGDLIYRRILLHSHADEQPFIRTGGPVDIDPDAELIIRAYMHPTGYGGKAIIGTVNDGFENLFLPDTFAGELATADPQPDYCLY